VYQQVFSFLFPSTLSFHKVSHNFEQTRWAENSEKISWHDAVKIERKFQLNKVAFMDFGGI
jgi:hypothetical protein